MDKYGLIGYPLGHSFSVTYFNEKFQSENIDAEYVNFEIPSIEDFPEVVDENLNSTSPSPTRNRSSPTWTNSTRTRPR